MSDVRGAYGRIDLAYLEIKRGDRLVKRREVDDTRAEKGYPVRIGEEKITLHLGETKQVGSFTLTLKADFPEEQAPPAVLVSGTDVSESDNGPGQENLDAQRPNIPGYEITGRLGSGGMGSVWFASQLSTNRQVAIKLMSQSFVWVRKGSKPVCSGSGTHGTPGSSQYRLSQYHIIQHPIFVNVGCIYSSSLIVAAANA